jgi:hypothetical protein
MSDRPAAPAAALQRAALEAGVHRRMFRFGVGFAFALAPLYLGIAVWHRDALRIGLLTLMYAAIAALALWVRRSGDHRRALMGLHAAIFMAVSVGAVVEPGTQTPWFWWMSVIPFVTVLGGARRAGVAQGVAVVAYAVAAWRLNLAPVAPDPLRLHLAEALSTVYACAFVALASAWRRELERALDAAAAAEVAAAQARTRFLARLGHEIRTPLSGLMGSIELLRGADRLQPAQCEALLSAQSQSAQALMTVLDDALDWCKLDAGRMVLAEEPLDLQALLYDVAEMFAVAAARKGVDVTVGVEDGMATRFRGDAGRLRQVLANLVGNAVKFTDRGFVHLHLRRADDASGVCVAVSDSGIGLSPEQAARLFSPFVQAEPGIARRFGGSGLGLAICQELVRCMGGRIQAEGELGVGSRFTVVLPLRPAPEAQAPCSAAAAPRVQVAAGGAGLREHLATLLRGLHVEARFGDALPASDPCQRLTHLLVDAPLLAACTDVPAWLDAQAALGRRVAVLCPLDGAGVHPAVPAAHRLHKPLRPQALAAWMVPAPAPEPRPAASPRALPRRVLLCDDNPVNQIVLQAMLVKEGAWVAVAGTGLQALEQLSAQRFDLVLMDLDMPELDGAAATREWRRIESAFGVPRTPIVAISAEQGDTFDDAHLLAAGLDARLPKPFTLDALRACLERWSTDSPARQAQGCTAA